MEIHVAGRICMVFCIYRWSGKEEKKSVNILTDLGYVIFLFILKINHNLIW